MASNFTHPFVGLILGKTAAALLGQRLPARFWLLSALCPVLPDADVIAFRFGIPYEHVLGHRGLSHSFAFAVLLGLIATKLAFPAIRAGTRAWWGWLAYFSGVTASHTILDAMTTGGLGVAFFAPFENTRYFLPWRPIRVSPIGIQNFFNDRGLAVFRSELLYVWAPLTAIYAIARLGTALARRRA